MRKALLVISALLCFATSAAAQEPQRPTSTAGENPVTRQLWLNGGRYFIQQNFAAAIVPYQQALDADKQSPSLTKTDWFVLIDNLGMAYGITGD